MFMHLTDLEMNPPEPEEEELPPLPEVQVVAEPATVNSAPTEEPAAKPSEEVAKPAAGEEATKPDGDAKADEVKPTDDSKPADVAKPAEETKPA